MQIKSTEIRRIRSSLKWLPRIKKKQEVKKLKFVITFFQNSKYSKFLRPYNMLQNYVWNSGMLNFRLLGISIFGKHIAQKPYPLITSLFQTAILSISMYRTEVKMPFLESADQPGSEAHFLFKKKTIRKFDLM